MAQKEELQLIIRAKNEAQKELGNVEKSIGGLKKGFGGLNLSLLGIVGAFSFLGVQMVKAAAEFEQTKVAFTTMLGSAEKANTLLRDLAEFAVKTPFELQDVEKGAKALLAFGVEGNKIIPTLKSLGDVSAGLSVPMERLILNFGQVKAQAKLTGRELRDFAIAGVPILDELAKNLGKSKVEIQGMVSAGKIGFPEVEAAFRSMSSEGGRFNNLMDKQSKTLLGRISNLKVSWNLFLREQGQGLIAWAGMAIDWLSKIVDWLRRDAEGFNLVGKIIFSLIGFFKALGLTVFAVFQPIVGLARIMFETGKVGAAVVRDMINGFKNLGKTMTTIFSAFGKAAKGNFKQAKLDLQGLMRDAFSETTAQMGEFDNVLADIAFGVEEGFQNAADAWVDLAKFEGFDAAMKKFGELGEGLKNEVGAGAAGAGAEAKKLMDAFDKLNTKIVDFAEKSSDALTQVTTKIKDLQKELTSVLVANVKENMSINQEFAEAFVAQEELVAGLRADFGSETNQEAKTELQRRLQFEEGELERFRTIAITFENEINEVRRKNSLSDIARTVEGLNNKRTLLNIEFEKNYNRIQSEISLEIEKFKKIQEINAIALKEQDKFNAQSEKMTVESINSQIEMYNQLASAIARAKEGKTTGALNMATSIEERAKQSIEKITPAVAITNNFNGNFSSEEMAENMGDEIVNKLVGAGLNI